MKNTMLNWLTVCCLAVSSMVLTAGCGQEEDDKKSDDGGTTTTPPSSTPTTNVDPVRVTAARTLSLSTRFVAGAAEAELRGTFPGMTWTGGTLIGAASNGYYSGQQLAASATGTYDFSYVALPSTWADFGAEANLRGMTADGRAFVQCNWFDGTKKVPVPAGQTGECHLKVAIAADGTVTSAGNMRSFQ